jgi:diguanylate cyclase (GGDEF)-like protein
MSDAPERDAPTAPGGDGLTPAPQPLPAQEAQPLPPQVAQPSSPQGPQPITAVPSAAPEPAARRGVSMRAVAWALVAVLCVAGGTFASIRGAHKVARNDAASTRRSFAVTATGIANNVNLSLQREEDLTNSTSTFFAEHPNASPAQFTAWARRGHLLRRYPELEKLGLVAVVRATQLAAFEEQITGHAATTPAPPSAAASSGTTASSAKKPTPVGKAIRIVPPGDRGYYCLTSAGLARASVKNAPAGLDYCARTPTLLEARDSGLSTYRGVSAGGAKAVSVQTPVYKGEATPSTLTDRMGAFVGWLTEVLSPKVILTQALADHSQDAVRLRYRAGSSNVSFTSGTPHPGALAQTTSFDNGWSVKSFAPPVSTDVFSDGHAKGVLIAGILFSALLGLFIFLLGARGRGGAARARAPRAPKAPRATHSDVPHEDLYDPLTGLPNRALLTDRAERMLARASRDPGLLVGALIIDIDWFKHVNDKLGADAGDQVLEIVAKRLEDVVRTHDSVARLEGDQFVVLVEAAARGARLDTLARRAIESLHKPVELADFGPGFLLTASIGVAFGRHETPVDLLRDANLALDAAKAAGKDRYTLFNANMRSVIEGQAALETELNAALHDGQFFLLYQPLRDLTNHQVVGLEAMIRWQHPSQGVLGPEEFIPTAEETGLIVPIGRWALEEACTRAAAWNVAGHRVGVSVTISAPQLDRPGFTTDILRALQQSGIDPAQLTLEIAETTVMRDPSAAVDRLAEIKQLGVRIAIDDFGSGYAYRSDLQRMPVDFLKVDRSSLAASDDEDYRSWLLEAILIFGRDLSLTVVAKGIETEEQMSTLQAMGCNLAQGFFLGEPVVANAVPALFVPAAAAAATGPVPGSFAPPTGPVNPAPGTYAGGVAPAPAPASPRPGSFGALPGSVSPAAGAGGPATPAGGSSGSFS